MRVLYVIDSLIGGGAEHSLAHMAPGFREHGVELHVAFLKDRRDVAAALVAAGAVLHPTGLGSPRHGQLRALVRLIRELEPDIVHTTLWEADVLGRTAAALTRTPVVGTFASSSYSHVQLNDPVVRRTRVRAAQAVDILTTRLVVRFQAVSEQVAQEMAPRMRLRPDRITVVPRARQRERLGEPSTARRTAVRASLGLEADRSVVLAIGRQEHVKGLDVLLDAVAQIAAHHPELVLLIAGRPGRASGALEAQVGRLAIEGFVRFLGARDDVGNLICAADVVVVPSRVEGLPGAVLEAMALETPVVATDLPVVIEAIGEHAAALVPVDDPAALAEAIRSSLDADTSEITLAARTRFDSKFSPEAVVGRLVDLYERALSESRWSRVGSARGRG